MANDDERQARLAKALRANLRRRKEQAREKTGDSPTLSEDGELSPPRE